MLYGSRLYDLDLSLLLSSSLYFFLPLWIEMKLNYFCILRTRLRRQIPADSVLLLIFDAGCANCTSDFHYNSLSFLESHHFMLLADELLQLTPLRGKPFKSFAPHIHIK